MNIDKILIIMLLCTIFELIIAIIMSLAKIIETHEIIIYTYFIGISVLLIIASFMMILKSMRNKESEEEEHE